MDMIFGILGLIGFVPSDIDELKISATCTLQYPSRAGVEAV